jgi:hypothetical protein
MPQDDRVTAYIERAQPFARPILAHIRALVHQELPDVAETMKWGMPFFEWQGKPLANMAAFKAHASFGFWQREAAPAASPGKGEGMGQFGKLASLADLPPDAVLQAMVRDAAALLAAGAPTRRAAKAPKAEIPMPDDLATALATDAAAAAHFNGFPPGARREYLEWVTSAKQPATRARRITTTVAQAAEGKRLNWKYEDC